MSHLGAIFPRATGDAERALLPLCYLLWELSHHPVPEVGKSININVKFIEWLRGISGGEFLQLSVQNCVAWFIRLVSGCVNSQYEKSFSNSDSQPNSIEYSFSSLKLCLCSDSSIFICTMYILLHWFFTNILRF